MQIFRFIIGLLLCTLLSKNSLLSQDIEVINSNNGLSSDEVNFIFQDSKGFLWFLTQNGIDLFDGHSISSFNIKYLQNEGVNHSLFLMADEDPHGNIWFCSEKDGAIIFDTKTNEVQFIDLSEIASNKVLSVLCDSRERVWLGTTNGLVVFDLKTHAKTVYKNSTNEGSIPDNYIQYIYEDNQQNIWIGTWGQGLCLFREKTQTFKSFKIFNPGKKIPERESNQIYTIYEDHLGNLWVGAWQAGLFVLKYDAANDKLAIISRITSNPGSNNSIIGNIIYSINQDQNKNIWLGTPYGINIIRNFYSDSTIFDEMVANEQNPTSITYNEVTHIFRDKSGIIWAATKGGGINKIDLTKEKFQHYTIPVTNDQLSSQTIKCFHTSKNDELYIGIKSRGFGIYNFKNNTFTSHTELPLFKDLSIDLNTVECFHKDLLGNLWMGTRYSGLLRQDSLKKKITVYNNLTTQAFWSKSVSCIVSDTLNQVWVGTPNDLYLFTPKGAGYSIASLSGKLNSATGKREVHVNSLYIDDENILWVGTMANGLLKSEGRITNKKFSFKKVALNTKSGRVKSNNIQTVFQDSKKRLWIGTNGAGLYRFDNQSGNFIHFGKNEGFYANIVNNIIEDNDRNLWLNTNKGLSFFRQKADSGYKVINYNVKDGLQGNLFNKNASLKDKKGILYFGGHYGFNRIDPKKIRVNNFTPPVAITRVKILDKDFTINPEHQELILSHKENYFSISFSALSFSNPEKNRYAYQLSGFDNAWRHTEANNRTANYTNLKPGKYLFKVKASNSNDVWNRKPATLSILVKPAPYKTWWAYSIYIILAAIVLAISLRFLLERIKMRQALKMEQFKRIESENVNQFKLRFFTNISHELLTPLSILTCLINNTSENIPNQDIPVIRRNIRKLIHLIRQLLEFRKVETGSLKVKIRNGNVIEFLKILAGNFEPLAKKKQINYTIELEEKLEGWFDSDILDKIFHNVLSNAFKYTGESGTVNFLAKQRNEEKTTFLDVVISDNGKGIPEKDIPHIFDRFYRLDSEYKGEPGTGIGLSLTKNLVEAHLGSISIESKVGAGTILSISIPLSKSSYPKESIKEEPTEEYYIEPLDIENIESPETDSGTLKEWEIDTSKEYKILVIEDNNDFRQILKNYLEKTFIVKTASDGRQALELVQKEDFELIVSDVMMPEINGIEFCQKMKASLDTSHIPIIMLTAKTTEEDQIDGYEIGADSYMTKPVNPELLLARINSIIKSRKQLRDMYKDSMEILPEKKLLSVDEEFLMKAKQFVLKNVGNTNFSIKDLYEHLGVSNSTLNRKLNSLTGMKPNAFVRKIRLKTAAQILKDPSVSVSEAMYKTGFNDLSYFGSCFKKEFGVSPSDYSSANLNK